ncbi:MAG: DUF4132 domain-containing protein [Thermomicrobiales bacterium]
MPQRQLKGLSRDDLDELLVPGFGLQDGVVRRDFGEYIAEIAILGADRVDLCWLRPDGKRQKSVPAPVKRDNPDQIKDLKRIQKEIRETLATQHRRIERLMIRERDWDYSIWRERYLDHPLVSHIARRLIWTVEQDNRVIEVAWLDGRLVDVENQPLNLMVDNPRVRLWHPIRIGCRDCPGLAGVAGPPRGHATVQASASRDLSADRCRARDRNIFEPVRRSHPAPASAQRAVSGTRLALPAAGGMGRFQRAVRRGAGSRSASRVLGERHRPGRRRVP